MSTTETCSCGATISTSAPGVIVGFHMAHKVCRIDGQAAEVERLREQNDGFYAAIQMAQKEQERLRAALAGVPLPSWRAWEPWEVAVRDALADVLDIDWRPL